MDTIDKNLPEPSRPRRRLYSPDLKAKIIRECLRPGVSIAFVARQYDINDNLLVSVSATHIDLALSR